MDKKKYSPRFEAWWKENAQHNNFVNGWKPLFYDCFQSARVAAKKDKTEDDECFPRFVELWTKAYPDHTFNAVSGSKIKSLIKQIRQSARLRGKSEDADHLVAAWAYLLAYLKRGGSWYNGKSLSVIDSNYGTIDSEIKNGKQQGPKKSADRFSDFSSVR